jgi:hypothetical protein
VTALATWWNTDLAAAPRFDGAGYAVLAESIASGRGYREIDDPLAPRHAHFPPGYPLALAALWRACGSRSAETAHVFSLVCTLGATLAAWRWFRLLYVSEVAGLLGLALAINWTWGRTGGAIQSEPMFMLLCQLALLAAHHSGRRGGVFSGVVLGTLLAACVLTRHVGIALAVAAGVHLIVQRQRSAVVSAGLTFVVLMLPWIAWLVSVHENTQVGLVGQGWLPALVATQALFYIQRLPDQLTAPFVEFGTVFRREGVLAAAANAWALVASGLVMVGWARALRSPRRRLAGLASFATAGLLLVWPFTEAGRFLIPLVPCLLVGAVEGLAVLAVWARLRRPRTVAAAVLLAISIPYSAYALVTGRAEAQRRLHREFDEACTWMASEGRVPGPVMTRHPGEVYWQTGRPAIAPPADDPELIAQAIERFGVAYILLDEERYANAPENPLLGFVRAHPERVRTVWSRAAGRSAATVFEVVPTGANSRPAGP